MQTPSPVLQAKVPPLLDFQFGSKATLHRRTGKKKFSETGFKKDWIWIKTPHKISNLKARSVKENIFEDSNLLTRGYGLGYANLIISSPMDCIIF